MNIDDKLKMVNINVFNVEVIVSNNHQRLLVYLLL